MVEKKAVVRQVNGMTLTGKSDSNHWVVMDGSATVGGAGAGSSPKELVLVGLGGCTAMDVISILNKKRAPMTDLEVRLSAKVGEDHPKAFTDVHIEYVVTGDGVRPEDVERAIELSTTKYCSVSAMLRPAVKITHSYTIVPATTAKDVATAAR
jgi:putative redox protein